MTDSFVNDLMDFKMPIQLVLDGAIVANMDDHLASFALSGRPLFRETVERETSLAGPWLVVDISSRGSLERALSAAISAGKGVFWLGESASDSLFRHLRRLNAALMPDGRIVYFRHYDSDVLAYIVPLLNATQAAILFGPARVIGFVGGCGDGATVEKPVDLPCPEPGPIAFERWQIDKLNDRQSAISRNKISKLLRKDFPKQTEQMSEGDLYNRVVCYEQEALSMNLTSEAAILNWAKLNIETNNGASKNLEMKKDISSWPTTATDKIFLNAMPNFIKGYRDAKRTAEENLANRRASLA